MLREAGHDVEVAVEDDCRAGLGPHGRGEDGQVVVGAVLDLHVARLEPALHESGTGADALGRVGLVADQPFGQGLFLHPREDSRALWLSMANVPRMGKLRTSETTRAAELGIAALLGNVIGLVFTVVFTRVLGQEGYGSLAALLSAFLILTVPGYALQTTVAREISAAVAAGDPSAGAAVGRWVRRLRALALVIAGGATLLREPLAALIGVDEVPWGAVGAVVAGALWLLVSVERGALVGFQRYRLVGASIVAEQAARLAFGLVLAEGGLDVTGAFLGTPLALLVVAAALW